MYMPKRTYCSHGGTEVQCKKTTMNLAPLSRLIQKKTSCNHLKIYSVLQRCVCGTTASLSSEEKITQKTNCNDSPSMDDMSEPTNCCMSGCANCVWIQYAEKLSATLEKSDVDVQKLIMDKVQDPNMRAFLSMELRFRNISKE